MTKLLRVTIAILALSLSFAAIYTPIALQHRPIKVTKEYGHLPLANIDYTDCAEVDWDYINDEYGPLQFNKNQWRSEDDGMILGFSAAEDSKIYYNPNCI